jgi:hypothetical protein
MLKNLNQGKTKYILKIIKFKSLGVLSLFSVRSILGASINSTLKKRIYGYVSHTFPPYVPIKIRK